MSDPGYEHRKATFLKLVDAWRNKFGLSRLQVFLIMAENDPASVQLRDLFAFVEVSRFLPELFAETVIQDGERIRQDRAENAGWELDAARQRQEETERRD